MMQTGSSRGAFIVPVEAKPHLVEANPHLPDREGVTMVIGRLGIIVFFSLTMAGCIQLMGNSPADVKQAQAVRITSNQDVVKGCKHLGNVNGEIDTFWGGDTNTLMTQLRVKTAKLGGNVAMMVGSIQTVKQRNGSYMSGEAEAYACDAPKSTNPYPTTAVQVPPPSSVPTPSMETAPPPPPTRLAPPGQPPASSSPSADTSSILLISVPSANLRESPGTNTKILVVLSKGTRVTVIGKANQWYRVRLDSGMEGWVAESVTSRASNLSPQYRPPPVAEMASPPPASLAQERVEVRALAGTWKGTLPNGGPFTWTIREDGTYETVTQPPTGQSVRGSGRIVAEGSRLRWSNDSGTSGNLTLETLGAELVLKATVDKSTATFVARKTSPLPAPEPSPSTGRSTSTPDRDTQETVAPRGGVYRESTAADISVKELTRESAAALLRRSPGFPRAVTYDIPVGPEVNVEVYIKANYSVDQARGLILDNSFGCLQRLGYINITPNTRNVFGTPLTISAVSVTERGRAIGDVVNKRVAGYNTAYVFRVAEREVLRITGIKNTNDGSAIAEFEWQQGNPNEVYRCMLKPNSNVYRGVARFSKFDDGWRLENVSLP